MMLLPTRRKTAAEPRWRSQGASSGPASRLMTLILVLVTGGWLGWPLGSSATAPDVAGQLANLPLLAAAIGGLLACLVVALWWDSGQRPDVFAPVSGLVGLGVFAGLLFGGPAGFLTAAATLLIIAAITGQLAAALPSAVLVWGLWGLAGATLRNLGNTAAWLAAIPVTMVLGVVSEPLLALGVWVADANTTVGTFVPGLEPWPAIQRWWRYSTQPAWLATGLVRGLFNAALVGVAGLPLLRALRQGFDNRLGAPGRDTPRPAIPAAARERRSRSARLQLLWPDRATIPPPAETEE